jgi:hypothetical protein
MGASNSTPSLLLKSSYPTLTATATNVVNVADPNGAEAVLGACRRDAISAALRGDAVTLDDLFSEPYAQSLAACMAGSKLPFTVRIPAEHDDVVVVGRLVVSACCASAASWELALLSAPDSLREKALQSAQRGPHDGPLLFRCTVCSLWSTDGVRYSDHESLITPLREAEVIFLHRSATSNCRRCRAAARAAAAGDIPSPPTHLPTETPGPARPIARPILLCISVGDKAFAARLATALLSARVTTVPLSALQSPRPLPVTHLIIDVLGETTSGLQTVRALRGGGFRGQTLAVAAADSFCSAAMAAGADRFIPKSVSEVQLRVTLYDFLAR